MMAKARVGAALLAILAASCGGGGGSPPATPPPPPVSPPPSPPSPPSPTITAVATTSAATVDEGQPFRLDASGSTTTSGAALSYAWTQTGGPAVTIANPATAVLDLTAPEVTANAIATFRVTVTGGTNSAQANVDVNLANIAQTPVHTTLTLGQTELIPYSITTLLGFNQELLIGFNSPFIAGNISLLVALADTSGDIHLDTTGTTMGLAGNYSPTKTYVSLAPALPRSADPSRLTYAVVQEDLNRLIVLSTPNPPLRSDLARSLDRPCAVSWKIQDRLVYIGQRTRGFTLASVPTSTSDPGTVHAMDASGSSLCALLAPDRSIQGSVLFNDSDPSLRDVLAVDTDSNVIYHYARLSVSSPSYVLKETVPLQLNSTATLTLAAQAEVGSFNEGLVLAYTDGQHRGVHRLVVIGFNAQRNIVQETHSWPVGVPAAILNEDLDRDDDREVAIITSSSPQAVVFEAGSPTPPSTTADFLPLGDARFVEIGLGATTAVTSLQRVFDMDALYVGYRDRKEVRALLLPDN